MASAGPRDSSVEFQTSLSELAERSLEVRKIAEIIIPDGLRKLLAQKRARWEAIGNEVPSNPDRACRLGASPPASGESLLTREGTAAAKLDEELGEAKKLKLWCGSKIDWRNNNGNYVTEVRDQHDCAASVAFACCAAVEATWQAANVKPGNNIDFSEADLFHRPGSEPDRTCQSGWWPDDALADFAENGVANEINTPFLQNGHSALRVGESRTHKGIIKSFSKLATLSEMRKWLCDTGPLVACFTVYEDFFSYQKGVYHHLAGDVVGGQAVCVVGFDDTQNCWICKNSWGKQWGMAGFFQIQYGQCGIDREMWGVDGVSSSQMFAV